MEAYRSIVTESFRLVVMTTVAMTGPAEDEDELFLQSASIGMLLGMHVAAALGA